MGQKMEDNNIIKKPFTSYSLESEEEQGSDIFTVRLNKDDREILNNAKLLLRQQKDSTALKQLARLGSIVLHDQKTTLILNTILNNERRNKRIGIQEIDIKQ